MYYNSYGTQLVQNSHDNASPTGVQYGAAVLGIKSGATGADRRRRHAEPAAGTGAGCRVCHVVSADGSHAHRAARRQSTSHHLELRPEERQRRDGAHRLRQHLRLGGPLHRRLDGAHQHGPARRRASTAASQLFALPSHARRRRSRPRASPRTSRRARPRSRRTASTWRSSSSAGPSGRSPAASGAEPARRRSTSTRRR